ncbi:MAG: tetratricopeptide repeat protein, partial [Magnetococcales bacterium]|nr:tetratricopeptide repeat protein [Magnetococcales bacterium]
MTVKGLRQAVRLQRAGQRRQAERIYRRIIGREPHHPEANHNLGVLLVETGQFPAALPLLKSALEAAPARAQYWLSYLEALLLSGRSDSVEQVLARGRALGLQGDEVERVAGRLQRDKGDRECLLTLFAQGRHAELLPLAATLAGRTPGDGQVWRVWGLSLMLLGRFADALPPMLKSAELLPDHGEISGDLGVLHYQAGHFAAAEVCLRRAVEIGPEHVEAWSVLGLTAQAQGRAEEAVAHLTRAVGIRGDHVPSHYNLGILFAAQGRVAEAEASYRRVLELQPDHVKADNNLANLLKEQGRLEEAETRLLDLVARHGEVVEAYHSLGAVQVARHRFVEAEATYRQALRLHPRQVEIHNALGVLLGKLRRHGESEEAFRVALALAPDHAGVWNNLGVLCVGGHRFVEAEEAFRQAARIDPEYAGAWINLSNLLKDLARYQEAEAACHQALRIQPDNVDVHYNRGVLLQEQQRYQEAEAAYRHVLTLDPAHGDALAQACHCAMFDCRWQSLQADSDAMRRLLAAGVVMPTFPLLSLPDVDGMLQRRASERYLTAQMELILAMPPLVDPRHHPRRDRLRIGYVSVEFHNHPITQLLSAVIEAHDRERFVVYGYSAGPDADDEGRRRMVGACDHFRNLAALADLDSAMAIVDDGIDILLDLTGYMRNYRPEIIARRPAPVVVNFGYPSTMGHPRMADYKISDRIATPLRMADQFSETLALLPRCQQPNDRSRTLAGIPSRKEAGLPEAGFVFCSFNQNFKFNPESFSVWCRLLNEVDGSVLWLPESTVAAMSNLRREAALRGVTPERLIFARRTRTLADHLGRLALADLA